jgi:EAL domain-containing protein (putative c-di-GMP-specific phosphodiesterase class I)
LNRAKTSGRNQYQFYEPEMNARGHELLALETDLRRALEREEFILHYQPQFHLCSGRIAGFEALLRWRHPARGQVPPSDFVPLLEESGLIVPAGEWILRRACAESRKLRDLSGAPVPVSVNVSARQFGDHRLVDELRRILRDEGMPPEDLELEITESTIMQDVQTAGEILAALDGLGVRLAIDDFGTGYSSLAYLKRFPLNALKIDREFIQDLPWEDNCATITEASISLGHRLGLEVIAEGVETSKQLQFLRAHGCDMVQGHYIGRPMPLDAAAQFVLSHRMPAPANLAAEANSVKGATP